MKNLLKISLAAMFGVATLAAAPKMNQLDNKLSMEEVSVQSSKAFGDFTFGGFGNPTPISLGTTTFNASLALVYKYSFTAPAKGYYVVEAFSNDQTFLCVKKGTDLCIYDGGDERGDNNAKVRFLASKNGVYTIYIARDGSLVPLVHEDVSLTVRKGESVAIVDDYGNYYGSNIVTYHNNFVYNNMQGYYQHTTYNMTYKDEIINKLNNEMFYITGQADVPNLNSLRCYGYMSPNGAFTTADIGDMSNTRLALWGINYSGRTGGFAQTSVNHGAKCAIGFYGTWTSNYNYDCPDLTEIGEFCRLLISYLCSNRNKTIQEGLNYIYNTYYRFSNFTSYVRVFGNSHIKLFQNTASNHPFDITKTFLTDLPDPGQIGHK